MEPKAILDGLYGDDAYEMLFSIEPMPKYVVSLDCIQEETAIGAINPTDGHRYETLGILDNGIAPIPHLAPWMGAKRWTVYPESAISPTYGTFVAGVALYGDICEGKEWVGHEVLDIAGWVFVWAAVDLYFFERQKLKIEHRRSKALSEAELHYLPNEKV